MNSYVTAPARHDDPTVGYVTVPRGRSVIPTGYVSNVNYDRVANGYVTVPVHSSVAQAGMARNVGTSRATRGYAPNDRLQSAHAA